MRLLTIQHTQWNRNIFVIISKNAMNGEIECKKKKKKKKKKKLTVVRSSEKEKGVLPI